MTTAQLKPREQGDLGELSAMEWLASKGAKLFLPIGHSPDIDIVAELQGRLHRIEVKTSTYQQNDRWSVLISTRGGNQSWTGLVKYFEPERCDFSFVHVGDGRRWFIPTGFLDCKSSMTLGGEKYAQFEIERGRPLAALPALQSSALGEFRSGQTGRPVKALAQPSQVRILPPPLPPPTPCEPANSLQPSSRERRLGRRGQAVINQKRRVTIPQAAFFGAGFQPGDRLHAKSDGPGRVLLEQMELPSWAREDSYTSEPATPPKK